MPQEETTESSAVSAEAAVTTDHASNDSQGDEERVEGEVKWFDVKKGFGFIGGPEGEDVFVHFSAIGGNGFRTLKDGEPVSYSMSRGDKGFHAIDVRRLDPPEPSEKKPQQESDRPAKRQPQQGPAKQHGGFKSASKQGGHRDKPRRNDGGNGNYANSGGGNGYGRRPSIEAPPEEHGRSAPTRSTVGSVGRSQIDHGLPVDDDDDGYVG